MKRFTISIFLIFYLLSTASGKIYIHYCMGEVTDIAMTYNESESCKMCSKNMSSKITCCKDEAHQLKTTEKHIFEKTQVQLKTFSTYFYHSAFDCFKNNYGLITSLFENNTDDYPKKISDYRYFIKYQNLRI